MTISKTLNAALAASALSLSGCYVLPAAPDGQPLYPYAYPSAVPAGPAYPAAASGGPAPAVLQARLYPANDVAAQTGVVSGTVTNMMNGKGRFQLQYGGEVLVGEATAVQSDAGRGVASAYGTNGGFMSCEYQLNTPRQGAGNCTFSNGAQYKLHIGM